ncbi:HYR domain-containing protein, partial [Salegentibacter sp. UBA1130]|uniref:HYR domain-containing protein n=1 Tax=Salegentibacter sp. UBA1130 TaxID=1947451 RepID=UPI00258102D2
EENEGSPAQPEAIVSQQPTCEDITGTIAVTTEAGISYTLLDENQNALSNSIEKGEFLDLTAGTYFVKAKNGGCETISEVLVIEENEGIPAQPEAIVSQQPTCEDITGAISVTTVQGITYSLLDENQNAVNNTIENGEFSNLVAGTYFVQSSNGDCEAISEAIIIEENAGSPESPVITSVTNTTCGESNGIIEFELTESLSYILKDSEENEYSYENGIISNLTSGTYYLVAQNNDCESTVEIIVEADLDEEAPVIISCPTDLTSVNADEGMCSASNLELGDLVAEDNCDSELSITNDAPEVFEPGETIVTWTVSDKSGNITTCTQTIIVIDNQAPIIAEVETINTSTDADTCGAMISINAPQATDNCSVGNVNGTRDDNQALDAEYPVGTTIITWTATDGNRNEAVPVIQIVNVEDNQAPVIAEVETINNITDADTCGAMISINAPEAKDNCSVGNVIGTRDDNQDLDAEYPVGTTSITWTATDENGNQAEPVIQTVTVTDNQAPSIECPENMIFSSETNVDFATVNFEFPLATDNCEVIVEQTGGPISGSQFPIGTTTVTFTATDGSGNTSKCSFDITIEDTEDPSLECPLDISKDIDARLCAAVVEFETPEGFDNSGDVTVEQTAGPSSGEVFPVGTTTITFTASDSAGNTTSCSFIVTVIDDQAPVIVDKNDITVNTDPDLCGAIVEYDIPSASDDCGLESIVLTKGLAPGSEFPIGQTTVTYTATDINGNSANSSFTVTVIDKESPKISCPEDITLNVEFGTGSVVVNYEAITGSDNCSETSIELIEGYASGEEFPIGETIVTYKVTDAAGNSANCSFTVIVEEDLQEIPPAPDAPQVDLIQPDCVTPTGVILINIENGLTYSIDGENYYAVDEFTALEPGTYSITARDEFDQISEATVVTLEDPVASEIETSTISLCTEDITFDLFELLQGDYDTSGTWVDPENTGALNQGTINPALLQVGTYTFNYQLNNGICNSTTEVTVSINDDCVVLPCSLEDIQSSISKAVTPNNDNHNDYFSIDFASECGFTYDVKIFNRWGSKVYEAINYQNDWDGYSTNSITSSNQLPSGTYFYILEIRNSGFAPIQGYIYLGTK